MADPRDLTDLQTLKNFLVPVNTTTTSDLVLAQLITGISLWVNNYTGRNFLAANYNEIRHSNRRASLRTINWPIISVASLQIDGVNVALAKTPVGPGYVYDDKFIYLRAAFTGGGGYGPSATFGGWQCGPPPYLGIKDVTIGYSAGYVTPGQIAVGNLPNWVAGTTTPVGVQILLGNGFFYSAMQGGKTGVTQPTFPIQVGQTVNDNGVLWLCQGAYAVPPVDATPLPADLVTGVLEQIAYHFTSRARVGVTSVGEGPARVGLLVRGVAPLAQEQLQNYQSVVSIGDFS